MSDTRDATIKYLGQMSEGDRQRWLRESSALPWKHSRGEVRDYYAWADGQVLYVKLEPGQEVHPHKDAGIRTHYVLQTNPDVLFMVDGEMVELSEGGIYELDTSCEHSCVNGGDTDRIHRIEL